MRQIFLVSTLLLAAGCWSSTPEPEPANAPAAQRAKAPPGAKAKGKAKAKRAPPSKAKSKTKAKSQKAGTPPKEYGAEGEVKGELKLTAEELEEGKTRSKAELVINWQVEGEEPQTETILLGHAPGQCSNVESKPFTENDTEITPLWSAHCKHEKATALIVLYPAGNLLLIKRAILGADEQPGPWKPVRKLRFAKGAQLTN